MKSDGVDIALNPSVLDFVEDIKTLEQACLAVARHLFVALIEALDDALLAQKPKRYKCVGKRPRTLSTLIGDIVIQRRLYVHASKKRGKKKGSKARFLLDERLNIQPRRRVTHGLLRLIVSAATRLSFEKYRRCSRKPVSQGLAIPPFTMRFADMVNYKAKCCSNQKSCYLWLGREWRTSS